MDRDVRHYDDVGADVDRDVRHYDDVGADVDRDVRHYDMGAVPNQFFKHHKPGA